MKNAKLFAAKMTMVSSIVVVSIILFAAVMFLTGMILNVVGVLCVVALVGTICNYKMRINDIREQYVRFDVVERKTGKVVESF